MLNQIRHDWYKENAKAEHADKHKDKDERGFWKWLVGASTASHLEAKRKQAQELKAAADATKDRLKSQEESLNNSRKQFNQGEILLVQFQFTFTPISLHAHYTVHYDSVYTFLSNPFDFLATLQK